MIRRHGFGISDEDRLLTRIETCISLDRKKPTELHIAIEQVIDYLQQFNVAVPPYSFEQKLEQALNQEIVGKIQLGHPDAFPSIARFILMLAMRSVENAEFSATASDMWDKTNG